MAVIAIRHRSVEFTALLMLQEAASSYLIRTILLSLVFWEMVVKKKADCYGQDNAFLDVIRVIITRLIIDASNLANLQQFAFNCFQ